MDISLGQPLVEWFNRVARPTDIARVDNIRQVDLLDQITVGRKMVVFKSFVDAKNLMPSVADKVDIIGYNLEHGPANPPDEQADPVRSILQMRELARQYGKKLALGPDHRFALSHGVAMAPYVDIFVLQVQLAQTEPEQVHDFVMPLIPELRRANPDLEVSVQVRTEGDVTKLVDLVESIDGLNGVSILTSPDTTQVAEALVEELRTRKPEEPTPAATPETAAINAEGNPAPLAEPAAAQLPALSWLLLFLAALVGGAIGGAIVAVLICASLKPRRQR